MNLENFSMFTADSTICSYCGIRDNVEKCLDTNELATQVNPILMASDHYCILRPQHTSKQHLGSPTTSLKHESYYSE